MRIMSRLGFVLTALLLCLASLAQADINAPDPNEWQLLHTVISAKTADDSFRIVFRVWQSKLQEMRLSITQSVIFGGQEFYVSQAWKDADDNTYSAVFKGNAKIWTRFSSDDWKAVMDYLKKPAQILKNNPAVVEFTFEGLNNEKVDVRIINPKWSK